MPRIVFVIPVFVLLAACAPAPVGVEQEHDASAGSAELATGHVMVVAHRSCWRQAPENSLAAMDHCIALGVDMLEVDVRKTKDNQLVVIHDETVDRTTNMTGLVSDFTLSELTSFRLRDGAGGNGSPITESTIPSLAETLEHLKGRVQINLDAKEAIRTQAVDLVMQIGMLDQIIVKAEASSPDAPVIKSAQYLDAVAFMPILRESNGPLARQVHAFESLRPVAYEVIYSTESDLQSACTAAYEQGARCWVNAMSESLSPGHSDDIAVMDPDRHWGQLVRLGVNMIQTDRPKALIEYLASQNLHQAQRSMTVSRNR